MDTDTAACRRTNGVAARPVLTLIGDHGHVDARPAWRVPAVEAGIDLAQRHFRRPGHQRLLYYRVRSGVLRVAARPRYDVCVSRWVLGTRDLLYGLRGDPPAVDPHFVGTGLRH